MVLSKPKTREQNESPSASSPDQPQMTIQQPDPPGASEDSMPTTKKTRTNPTRSARAGPSETGTSSTKKARTNPTRSARAGPSEAGTSSTKKARTNPTRSARATTSELPAANTTLPDPQLEVRLTRDTFIADDHVQIAISNLETMYVLEEDSTDTKKVPIPQSIKESGVLPDGYCVDFAFDPYVALHTFADSGYIYESHLTKKALDGYKAIINSPENFTIVPREIWEAKQQSTIEILGSLEDRIKKTTRNKSRGSRKRKH